MSNTTEKEQDEKGVDVSAALSSVTSSVDDVYPEVLSILSEGDYHLLDSILEPLHPSDTADLLERLPLELRGEVISHLPKSLLGSIVSEASLGVQENILADISGKDLAEVLEQLESDEAVDIVRHLDSDTADEVLGHFSKEQQTLYAYDEGTAGGLMKLEYVAVPAKWSVMDVLKYMRDKNNEIPEVIDTVYVLNGHKKLIGTIGISRLVRTPLKENVGDVMYDTPVSVPPEMGQEDVSRIFEKYDIYSCPVIDERGRVLGVIAIDDILDVVVKEHEADIMGAAGLNEGEDLFSSALNTTKKRFPWLFVNLLTAILASLVISLFEGEISELVVLAVLMPIVASMGGNAGTQTMTVAVRGLATKQLTFQNAFALLKKELQVGGFNGFILAFILGVLVLIVYQNLPLALVIWVATIANHLLAALAGIIIPIYVEKLGKDPALSSGVILTTVTDVGGFFIFLGLASFFLL